MTSTLDAKRVLSADRRWTVGVIGILVLAVVPFTTTPYVTELVFMGFVFTMLGVSWNLLAGYAGQISLGHAAFFGVGAFSAAWLTTPTRAGLPEAIQMPVVVALLGGATAAALLALVTGPIMFRLTGHYFAIGTLALAAIIQLLLLDLRQLSGGSTGYFVSGGLGETAMFFISLIATVAVILWTYRIVTSPPGLGMRAIHDDETAASSLGVNPLKYKMYAFVTSSFMAGLTGALYAQYTLYVNPESTLSVGWMIDTLVVVILGGMGTMLGPIFGAGLFLALDNTLRIAAGDFATTIEGLLIILFILFLPYGLYGFVENWFSDGDSDSKQASTGQAE